MVKTVTHREAGSFEIQKFKNLLEKPLNPPVITEICELSKFRARHHCKKINRINMCYILNKTSLVLSKL